MYEPGQCQSFGFRQTALTLMPEVFRAGRFFGGRSRGISGAAALPPRGQGNCLKALFSRWVWNEGMHRSVSAPTRVSGQVCRVLPVRVIGGGTVRGGGVGGRRSGRPVGVRRGAQLRPPAPRRVAARLVHGGMADPAVFNRDVVELVAMKVLSDAWAGGKVQYKGRNCLVQ